MVVLDRAGLEALLPHRAPFLLLDAVEELDDDRVVCAFTPRREDPLFGPVYGGHYPGEPVTPGVLLSETVFQAGAVLVGHRLRQVSDGGGGVPVVTRVRDARFRKVVRPETPLRIEAEIEDAVANAWYLKGAITDGGARVLTLRFTCALVDAEDLA
jgi:3-hydroxyacyl-[acyl-carrier-protein] dehydratase